MEAIYEAGGKLDLVITLPDTKAKNKSGRIYLDEFCAKYGVPLLKTDHINDEVAVAAIKENSIDWLFIIGWSQIAGISVLSAPRRGVLGMHPTLLPEGRGRAAIPWAILKGLRETGVTLFKMDAGVDTGPIAAQISIPLAPRTTATELYAKVDRAHTELMRRAIPGLLSDTLMLREQDESQATDWPGRRPEDGQIDLRGSVWDAERLVRAVTKPYPGAFYFREEKKIIIWRATIAAAPPTPDVPYLGFHDGFLLIDEWEVV